MIKINDSVLKYFNKKSKTYDIDNKKKYWKLCDELLWYIFSTDLDIYKSNFRFLDAGAGTGEWSYNILKKYPNSYGNLVDFSSNMLDIAFQKLKNFDSRFEINIADLNQLNFSENTFDIVFNFYVLPFIENDNLFIRELARVTKKNGYIITVAENYYNALALNILTGDYYRIENTYLHKYEKIAENIPKIKFHTIKNIEEIYKNNNIKIIYVKGFPIVTMTGIKEKITQKELTITQAIKNDTIYRKVIDIEKELVNCLDLANRGKYIYI